MRPPEQFGAGPSRCHRNRYRPGGIAPDGAGTAISVTKMARATGGTEGRQEGPFEPADPRGLDALASMRVPKAVPASSDPPGTGSRRQALRYRVLPRSVIGVSMLLLAFAIGAGFSGVVLYSYYQFKLNQTNEQVNALVDGYKGQFAKAEGDLAASEAAAQAAIAGQARNVQSQEDSPSQVAALVKQVAPSVFFVHTLDDSGQPAVGTAFVIASDTARSLLITSYTTVQAATRSPGPPIYVSQGDSTSQTAVTLSTWDPSYDLALLILPRGGLTALPPAPTSPPPEPGQRLFVVSGLGAAGASVTEGSVTDVSASGLLLDADIGPPFQGGPVVDQQGQVIAVGSRSYSPLGFSGGPPWFVPYVQAACNKVLDCPGGSLSGAS